MAKLSKQRRELRAESMLIAAELIETYIAYGISPEEAGLTQKEFDILEKENKRTALILKKMAYEVMKEDE